MKRPFLLCAVLSLLVEQAASAAPGLDLAWDRCYADGGASHRSFACNSNSNAGADANVLVASWTPTQVFPDFNGIEAFVSIYFTSPPDGPHPTSVPQWWGNGCAGKTVALVSATPPAGTQTCQDIWLGSGTSSLVAYYQPWYIQHGAIAPGPPNSAQIDVVGTFSYAEDTRYLEADGTEYFLFAITINNANTVGTDACTGCGQLTLLWLDEVFVSEHSPSPGGYDMAAGPQNTVCFQCGGTPVASRTWGALKSMYR